MPNTLTEKAIRQPLRVGMMLGALILPTLWTMSQDALSVLLGKPLLISEEITSLFAVGFVPGMILGAGILRAWTLWQDDKSRARRLIIGHSLVVLLGCALFYLLFIDGHLHFGQHQWQNLLLLLYSAFPLNCALAMFLFGLFMRGNRA